MWVIISVSLHLETKSEAPRSYNKLDLTTGSILHIVSRGIEFTAKLGEGRSVSESMWVMAMSIVPVLCLCMVGVCPTLVWKIISGQRDTVVDDAIRAT